MKRRVSYRALPLLAAGAMTLAGCGTAGGAAAHSRAAGAIHRGGTVVIAIPPALSPDGFFPVMSTATYSNIDNQIQALMYKPLLFITGSDAINYRRSIARKVTWNKAGTVYTITLGNKYRWSNGKPITSQDIVFDWSIMKAASQSNSPWLFGGAGFGGIPTRWKSVVARNAHTIVVTLNQPSNQQWFVRNGLGQIVPFPKAQWDKYPANMKKELTWINSVVNSPGAAPYKVVDGPYKFSSMQPNQFWAFVPNKHYGGHKSYVSKVMFQYETSDSGEFTGLKTGTINFGYLPYALWDSRMSLTNDTLKPFFLFGFNYMNINMDAKAGFMQKQFAQLYVRQALQMGIDQPGIVRTLYHNQAITEFGPLPSKPKTVFDDPALKNPYPYDPARGKKLLEAHGWVMKNGVLTKDGHPFTLTVMYAEGDTAATDSLQLITHAWAEEGISASLQPEPANTAFGVMVGNNQNKWDITYFPGGWTYEPDYYPTGGGLFAASAGGNYSHYNSAGMNHLVQLTYKPVSSQAQALGRLAQYQAYAVKQLPVIWMPYFPTLVVQAKNLHGVNATLNPVSNVYYPNYWWVGN